MPETIKVRLELSQHDADAEKAAAEATDEFTIESEESAGDVGAGDLRAVGFVGTVAIIAATTVSWIAGRMTHTWLKDREQGVQIDLRETPPVISRIAGVPNGFVVIVHPDGQVETQKVDYDSPDDLTALLTRIIPGQG
jgi:hypothetical protein